MGVSTTGACPGNAADAQSLQLKEKEETAIQASATYEVTHTAGSTNFRACYKSSGTGTFANRNIIVMPLP
jgi:hypothetical protein